MKRRREFHYAETIVVVLLLGLTLYLLISVVFHMNADDELVAAERIVEWADADLSEWDRYANPLENIVSPSEVIDMARAYIRLTAALTTERERCAKVCGSLIPNYEPNGWGHAALEQAMHRIRALPDPEEDDMTDGGYTKAEAWNLQLQARSQGADLTDPVRELRELLSNTVLDTATGIVLQSNLTLRDISTVLRLTSSLFDRLDHIEKTLREFIEAERLVTDYENSDLSDADQDAFNPTQIYERIESARKEALEALAAKKDGT